MKKSAPVYFICLFLVSSVMLTTMYVIYISSWDRLLIHYKTSYLDDQSLKLAFVIHDNIMSKPLNEERIRWINSLSRQYAVSVKYADPAGQRVWIDTSGSQEPAAVPYVVELPMVIEGELGGKLTATYDLSKDNYFPYFTKLNYKAKNIAGLVFIVLLMLSLVICLWLSLRISSPLRKNAKQAQLIMNGDLGTFMPVGGTFEQAQFAQAVNYLLSEFKQQEKWRKQLMQDLTHELRTPLTSVLSRLEAMIDGIYPLTENNMNLIYAEIDRLSRLVKDVEKLSEAEGARFTLNVQRIDMAQLLKGVHEGFLFLAQDKHIAFKMQPVYFPCYAEVDPDLMIQVLSNVISNAIKYTPSGGIIELALTTEDHETVIRCSDKGIGISAEDLPYIFNRFYRADKSRSRESGGLGVGLSIVHALVEAHGGTIDVESEPEQGSTFTIHLPIAFDSSLQASNTAENEGG
ncbi:sensor histidine kinase [Paenibacillus nasutitermitis]|uniref:sensor histidine kinase n=1 Tax=Paenibacillus nasutitermitis TaxID=1652958 RepID=UPI001E4F94F9|nr:HAMP domain-containing sensor histidine kinase [Paenibacillus nasutitermitis]